MGVEILAELLPELLERHFRAGDGLAVGDFVAEEAGVDLAATLKARVRTVAADGLSAERETNSVGTDKR